MKNSQFLLLLPLAIDQLWGSSIYTILDLQSMYILGHIQAGDEWKTVFSIMSSHYHYNVMAYGLVNAPAFFQDFMNKVYRNMANHSFIVYIWMIY